MISYFASKLRIIVGLRPMFDLRSFPKTRLRRIRSQAFSRRLTAEHRVTVDDLIYPMFIIHGDNKQVDIDSMPGIARFSIDLMLEEVAELVDLGVPAVALFPKLDDSLKTIAGDYAYQDDGLMQQATRAIKEAFPQMGVIVDGALDPYTTHGQDGVIDESGRILNDETCEMLARQALSLAQAGVDMIAPSDMMDGRVGFIRDSLEKANYRNTMILAYAAKYASNFYSPFRDAVDTKSQGVEADKRTYQMTLNNANVALHEVALDIQEGADIVMVKPGTLYLDILTKVKNTFQMPTFVYHVSGEYAMLKAAFEKQWLRERDCVMETMLAFKRAGADAILSYYAKQVAQWLK